MRLRTVSRVASRCKLRQSGTWSLEVHSSAKREQRGAVARKKQTATAMAGKQAVLIAVTHEGQAVAATMTGSRP